MFYGLFWIQWVLGYQAFRMRAKEAGVDWYFISESDSRRGIDCSKNASETTRSTFILFCCHQRRHSRTCKEKFVKLASGYVYFNVSVKGVTICWIRMSIALKSIGFFAYYTTLRLGVGFWYFRDAKPAAAVSKCRWWCNCRQCISKRYAEIKIAKRII